MIVGDPTRLAIEFEIAETYSRQSLLALGLFVLHIGGRVYGVREPDATFLANSFEEVGRRIRDRGRHVAPFLEGIEAKKIAEAFRRAMYVDKEEGEDNIDCALLDEIKKVFYFNHIVWAPDGDTAFDDGSYVLQFDVGNDVRIIAFKSADGDAFYESATLSDVWISADGFYDTLVRWRAAFESAWASMPKP